MSAGTVNSPQIIDQYSFLDYKANFGNGSHGVEFWVGEKNWRRLQAYQILSSYTKNQSRNYLNTENESVRAGRREYGDPWVVVETALSSMLGEDQTIVVPDAIDQGMDTPAGQYLTKLVDWASKERFTLKLTSCERNAVNLGDGVYVLGWNEKLKRPRLQVWDPGFYFPVWDESDPAAEFPETVHIAYDYELENELGETEKFLRRITWELVPLEDEDGEEAEVDDRPWNGDGPTTHTVLYSDKTWRYEDIGKEDDGQVFHLDLNRTYKVDADEEDLEIDWIPVVHITNTDTDSGERFGISVLSPILQVVDDIISTDTDLQAASATTGSPPLVVPDLVADHNDDMSITTYGPGEVLVTTGNSSGAKMIDTSSSLVALSGYAKDLLSRMSVNGRIPEALLGRVKPNEVPSGIALTLSFSPHSSMVRAMRQVREVKYPLLLKMVGRFFLMNGELTEIFEAKLKFGPYLPADKVETQNLVSQLYNSRLISLETAVTMLQNSGYPIDSVAEEVKRINSRDFSAAQELQGVVGDPNIARKFLGLPRIPQADVQPMPNPDNPADDVDEEEEPLPPR